ncbi:MAG: alpha/beta hydrolase [Deltaproteobacteria bacterium]
MGLVGEALDSFIERQIFFPDPHLVNAPSDIGLYFEDVIFEASDGVRLHGWLVPAEPAHALLLFCHGNAGNISHRLDNVLRLHKLGLSVFIFDYRGYGRSEGRISEKGFYLDAEAAYDTARERIEGGRRKLVVFGRSLGGIAAVHLGAVRVCDGLILESTFSNLGAMAGHHFPIPAIGSVLKNRLNAIGEIPQVKVPILCFHGDRDSIVPIRFGRELYDAARAPKEFITLAGADHNDTYLVGGREYFDKLIHFIDALPTRGEDG